MKKQIKNKIKENILKIKVHPEEFVVPDYLNVPWLTFNYVSKYGLVPDSIGKGIKETIFGWLPAKTTANYNAGDVIIHDEYYQSVSNEGDYQTDRFAIITIDDILEHKNGLRSLLPCGVVAPKPNL